MDLHHQLASFRIRKRWPEMQFEDVQILVDGSLTHRGARQPMRPVVQWLRDLDGIELTNASVADHLRQFVLFDGILQSHRKPMAV